jgi:hypothetical protein
VICLNQAYWAGLCLISAICLDVCEARILSYLIFSEALQASFKLGAWRSETRELQQQSDRIINREHFHSIACPCAHHTPDNMEREVHIQRASLSIALIRSGANAPEVRRDDAALFLKNLHRTINVCTHHDIKVSEDTSVCGQSGAKAGKGKADRFCAADKSSFRLAKTSLLGTFSR